MHKVANQRSRKIVKDYKSDDRTFNGNAHNSNIKNTLNGYNRSKQKKK